MLNFRNTNLSLWPLALWPLVILLMGLILTGAAWRYTSVVDDEKSLAEFNLHARDATHNVQERIKVYFGVLNSAGSFFAGSELVTRTEWNTYVNFLKPKEDYPGIEGMGFIRRIPDSQKKEFENTIRHELGHSQTDNTDYTIHPPGVRETYYPVTYFWPPLAHINLLGLDHGAYPAGLKALEMAQDSGMTTVSRDMPHAQGSDRKPPVLFMYPIYRNGLPSTTVDERRKAIWGFVYARINTDKLFHDAIDSSVIREIHFKAYDAGFSDQETSSLDKARIIYDTNPGDIPHALNTPFKPRYQVTQKVSIDGSTWLFYSASRPGGVSESRSLVPLLILLAGCILSISASLFTFVRSCQKQMTHYYAYHDHLTGLPNRRLLQDRFQQALANAQRHGTGMALLFLDLDNFKPVNDSLGHDAGDRVLKAVAACLASCLREGDTLSRLGGDEFIILLLNIASAEEASAVAQKIIDTLSGLVPLEGKNIHLGGSIGISMFPKDGAGFEELLKNADAAMYRAKKVGRNNFQFCTQLFSGHRPS